jgi:UDP-glucose 4-epimerase
MTTSTPAHSAASTPLRLLVVGGAGYIGSHMVKHLLRRGCDVVTFDNLSTGHRDAVLGGEFVLGDLADRAALDALFSQYQFDAVFHFASFIQVGESVKEPAKYYANNVVNTLKLLDAMVAHGVGRFVFSSTAAVYGEPAYTPIDEAHPKQPINPYGKTKWMVEQILEDYDRAYGLRSIALRYFNAAGADPEGQLGERHDPETHLIPLVLQAASGRRPHISVFGRDYDTPDGTCIRDYIHVTDLADAHWLALDRLMQGAGSAAYNLGNGNGFSVQQVIDTAASVTGRPIPVVDAPRREGDPARLVAESAAARKGLGWQPARDDLATIIADAWRWECKVGPETSAEPSRLRA